MFADQVDKMLRESKEDYIQRQAAVAARWDAATERIGADEAKSGEPSRAAAHEKQATLHQREAENNALAAAFFRRNPAFEEFLRLREIGAITF